MEEYMGDVKTIDILLIKPDFIPEKVKIKADLETIEAIVGGDFQEYMPFADEVAIVCLGKRINPDVPLNRAIYDEAGKLMDIIAGDFFICKAPIGLGEYESLSIEELDYYLEMFKEKERFVKSQSGYQVEKLYHFT